MGEHALVGFHGKWYASRKGATGRDLSSGRPAGEGAFCPIRPARCLNLRASYLFAQGVPGSGFGPSGEGYFRVTAFGSPPDSAEAVERIATRLRR